VLLFIDASPLGRKRAFLRHGNELLEESRLFRSRAVHAQSKASRAYVFENKQWCWYRHRLKRHPTVSDDRPAVTARSQSQTVLTSGESGIYWFSVHDIKPYIHFPLNTI
jgi:hypothetical protein